MSLTASPGSVNGARLEKLRHFFGIAAAENFFSAAKLLSVIEARSWPSEVRSVFVQPDGDFEAMGKLIALLTDDISLRETTALSREWKIADASDGFGDSLRGLSITPSKGPRYVANLRMSKAAPLISAEEDAVFFRLEWRGVPIFVSLAEEIIDLDAELTTPNFDVRDHFFAAVPIVLYLRWAFPETSWQPPETGACLIIDDPLLKSRYGFVRFRLLLSLMERYNFSTSIAFIPWNWRRSRANTVQLFRENPERFSVSVHGCDHTTAEFGTEKTEELRPMIADAVKRMSGHEQRTGLSHDQIMIFPQGVFSEAAMRELKRANFTAVVNTEIKTARPNPRPLKISEVWDLAVRRYADFPLYTRRYPRQGVENFAFDILLGKPCLVVIHHDFCRHNCEHLIKFIQRLNALPTPLAWRSLGEVVRRSYRRRELDPATSEIEMYAAEMLIENCGRSPRLFKIKRRETNPDELEEIVVGGQRVAWKMAGDYLGFEVSLPPRGSSLVQLRFKGSAPTIRHRSRWKIGLRRYLSEMRDNYLVPAKTCFSRA